MRISNYNIAIELPFDQKNTLFVHGYTGAIDLINKETTSILKQKEVNKLKALDSGFLRELELRGYVTQLTEEEEYGYFKSLASSLHKRTNVLRKFVIFVTEDCNFRCSYCFENEFSNQGERWSKQKLTKSQVDKLFNIFNKIEPSREKHDNHITLYGGEPLLRENFEVVKYLIEKGHKHGYYYTAITNGYDLNHFIDLCGKGKIESVQVTIDGTKEFHNKRRIHKTDTDSFSKIINNIELALNKEVRVSIRVNVDKSNHCNLSDLFKFFIKKGWTENKFCNIYLANTYHNCNTGLSMQKYNFAKSIFELQERNNLIGEINPDKKNIFNLLNKSISDYST